MRPRAHHRLRLRNAIRILVALLFVANLPISVALASVANTSIALASIADASISTASMAAPGRAAVEAQAMPCHEPAPAQAGDADAGGRSDPAAALQHLCCFTACLPLAPAADTVVALAPPSGEALPSRATARVPARTIGVDPPPPRR